MLDQDIIAYRVPKGAVGFHIYQGPLGMDFRVGDLCKLLFQNLVVVLTRSSFNKLGGLTL